MNRLKNILSILFNPFKYLAGFKSLLIGLITMAVTALLTNVYNIRFRGLHRIYPAEPPISLVTNFLDVFLPWMILTILIYIPTLFMKKRIRIVDIAGTLALANSLIIIMAIGTYFWVGSVFYMILIIILMIWRLILFYNAIKVSAGIKGLNLKFLYFFGIMSGEILSRLLLPILTGVFITHIGLARKPKNKTKNKNQAKIEQVNTMKQDIAKNIIENLSKRNFKRVRLYFDQKMKSRMPEKKLKKNWNQLVDQYGEFDKIAEFNRDEHGEYTLIYSQCSFSDTVLTAKFVFTEENKIGGLFVKTE